MRAMLISVQQANSLQGHEVEKITPVNLQRLTAQVDAEECQKGKIHYDRMPVGLVPKRFHESPHLSIYVAMLQSKSSKLGPLWFETSVRIIAIIPILMSRTKRDPLF